MDLLQQGRSKRRRRKQVDRLAQVLDDEMAVCARRRLDIAMAQQALHAVSIDALTEEQRSRAVRRSWKRIGRTFAVGQSFIPQRGQARKLAVGMALAMGLSAAFAAAAGVDQWSTRPARASAAHSTFWGSACLLELLRAAVHAALDLLLAERGEPALDEIDPERARRSEVLAAATLRAAVLPGGATILLLLGGVLFNLPPGPVPMVMLAVGGLFWGAGAVWLGDALRRWNPSR